MSRIPGKPSKVNVETTSGFDDLDQTAIADAKHWRFVPASDGHDDVAAWTKVTVHFQLAPPPSPQVTDSDVYALADIEDMMVCRRPPPPTGSVMAPKPVCQTKRQWDALAHQFGGQDAPQI